MRDKKVKKLLLKNDQEKNCRKVDEPKIAGEKGKNGGGGTVKKENK